MGQLGGVGGAEESLDGPAWFCEQHGLVHGCPAPQPICLPGGPAELGGSQGTCPPLCSGTGSCLVSVSLMVRVAALFISLDLKRE